VNLCIAATEPKGLPLSVWICPGIPNFLKTLLNSAFADARFSL